MPIKSPTLLLFSILLISTLESCSLLQRALGVQPEKPTIELVSLEIKSLSLSKIETQISLKVINHSSLDLELLSLDYQILFLKVPLAEGSYATKTLLKGDTPETIVLPLTIVTENFSAFAKSLLKQEQDNELQFIGQANVDTVVGAYHFKYDQKKKISSLLKRK